MKNILIIGAGKSSSYLIKYLLEKSDKENLHLHIGDICTKNIKLIVGDHQNATSFLFDVFDSKKRQEYIKKSDIVISMLPARLHIEVAKDCITYNKHMVTASYISRK
jgi:saccharopine dehydrogenase-like NADP-dependent oxidoreductase